MDDALDFSNHDTSEVFNLRVPDVKEEPKRFSISQLTGVS